MTTSYSQAWSEHKSTKEYKENVRFLKELGMKQPYVDNFLQNVFDAGWNASKVVIFNLKQTNHGK